MVPRLRSCLAGVVTAWLAASPAPAFGWGEKGHIVVARIAEANLSAKARAGIRDLVGDRSIADKQIAVWADLIKRSSFYAKKYPKNPTWHYIDLPIGVASEKVGDFCAQGNCVLEATRKFQAVLADPKAPQLDRKEALFFVVHLVGDLHQPLHCAEQNGDKGGNKRRVRLPGSGFHILNLHSVWDKTLVEAAMDELEPLDYADRLNAGLRKEEKTTLGAGDIQAWIVETNKVAKESAYDGIGENDGITGEPIQLSAAYVKKSKAVVELQMKRAGIRLARVLNAAFD